MRALCWVISLLAWMPTASAALACVERATGKLLDYQSHGRPGTCERNWVTENPQYGYTVGQIEERSITASEWVALRDQWIDAPTRQRKAEREMARQGRETAIRAKLGLSKAEFDDLRAALSD